MARLHTSSEEPSFFSLPQAKWAIGVLSMAIAVVGKDSLVGLILRQMRSEIAGIVPRRGAERRRGPGPPATRTIEGGCANGFWGSAPTVPPSTAGLHAKAR